MAEGLITETVEQTGGSGLVMFSFTVGVGIGLVGGYFIAQSRLKTKYEKIAEDEIAEMRKHYRAKTESSEEKKPLDEVMAERGYKTKLEGPDETVFVKVEPAPPAPPLASAGEGDVWDYEVEVASRQEGVPYVIHYDEWRENENDHNQVQITYFEGDDVLSDERDGVIDDQDAMVGLGNLSKFGHGSKDALTVYVRNDELGIDFEITHTNGKYATEVQGFSEDELKHSHKIQRRRRGFDDD